MQGSYSRYFSSSLSQLPHSYVSVIMTSKSSGTFVGGYLESALGSEDRGLFTRSQIWSVNFYGLSPLDDERGPEGCVNFLYYFDTVERGILSLRVSFQTYSE